MAVRDLSEEDRGALRAQYEEALGARLAVDPAFARAGVLYAFATK
jgi:hypothetical protein